MHDEVLRDQLRSVIGVALGTLANSGLAGLALCTDGGVSTLSALAVRHVDLAASDDPDLLFVPVDWPLDLTPHAFDLVGRELRRRYEKNPDFQSHVDNSFRLLVDVLEDVRRGRIVKDSVFLTVLSSDPDPYMNSLGEGAVERLNRGLVLERWRTFRSKWT